MDERHRAERGRPDDDPLLEGGVLELLAEQSGVALDLERSRAVRAGHAGFAEAVGGAFELLHAGAPAVLVGGVDSSLHPDVLRRLDAEHRLHALGVENGILPAEAAAFVLLAARPDFEGGAPGTPARVVLARAGREETVVAGEPNLAQAMTRLLVEARAALPGGRIAWVLSDINGERHRVHEWSRILCRDVLAEDTAHTRLLDDLGDVGAASGPLLLVIARVFWDVGCAPSSSVVLALHAEGPERGVVALVAEPEGRRPSGRQLPAAQAPAQDPSAARARGYLGIAGDALDDALLVARSLPGRRTRAALNDALDSARAAAVRFGERRPWEATYLDLAEASLAALGPVRAALETAGGAETPIRARLADAERALTKARSFAVDAVVAVQGRTLHAAEAPVDQDLRASVGLPALHHVERARVVAPLRSTTSLDDDFDLAEAEARGGSVEPARAPEGARDVRVVVRACLDDLGALGMLRGCDDELVFSEGIARFEQRLLDALDALAALGRPFPADGAGEERVDIFPEIARHARDAITVDPTRAFADTFALGCIAGPDTARAAVLALRGARDEVLKAHADALALAPNPDIDALVERLTGDADAARVEAALEVLRRRRVSALPCAVLALGHLDAGVRRAAAWLVAAAPEREAAAALLEQALDAEDDDLTAMTLATALVTLDAPVGLAHARRSLSDELAEPGALAGAARLAGLRLLAHGGGLEDASALLQALTADPEEAEAIGWFGHAAHVAPLLERLAGRGEDDDEDEEPSDFDLAVARALMRITGGPLLVEGPTVDSTPAVDLEAFRGFWAERRGAFAPDQRYRFGRPYTPRASLEEAASWSATNGDRGRCALELSIAAAGMAPRLDVHDWAARQRALLSELAAFFDAPRARALYAPGEWPAQRLGRRRAGG